MKKKKRDFKYIKENSEAPKMFCLGDDFDKAEQIQQKNLKKDWNPDELNLKIIAFCYIGILILLGIMILFSKGLI